MKAVLIARVSTEEQREAGNSLPAQVARLERYCKNKGFEIIKVCSFDESAYGEQRAEFDRVLDFILKQKEKIAVCCDKVDRLSRNNFDTRISRLYEKALSDHLELHFISDGQVITSQISAFQKYQFSNSLGMARYFSDAISDNVRRAMEQKLRKGEWLSKAPYGYKNITLPSGQKTIEIEPEQAAVVSKMYELYAQGNHSLQTIAERIGRQGTAKSSRGKIIIVRTVEHILKNPFYIGIMRVKGQLYNHHYPPIISEALFNRVQEMLRNHNKAPVQYAGKPILLRGMIKCQNCNGTISGYIKKGKYVYYSCHNTKRICVKKIVKEEAIMHELLTHFDNISLTDDQIGEIIEAIKVYEEEAQITTKRTREQLNRRINLARERTSKLIDMHVDGTIDTQTYRVKLEEYTREQQLASAELQSYQEVYSAEHVTAQEVLLLAREARQIFESSKMDEKQQLLRFFFSNLTLDREKLDVELRESFNVMSKHEDHLIWGE